MIPHAIIQSATYRVINICVWDRLSPWSPPDGCFVVDLRGHIYQPNIGDVWNPHTTTFAPPIEDLPNVPILGTPKVHARPVRDPIGQIPHRDINWTLCDQGLQSPEIFRKGREIGEIYQDRMKLPAFQYAEGSGSAAPGSGGGGDGS